MTRRARSIACLVISIWLAWFAGLAPSASSSADAPHTTPARSARARARSPRRRTTPRITAAQRRQIRRWHRRAPRAEVEVWSRRDPAPVVLRPIGSRERFELSPEDDGGFDGEALERAELAFAHREHGSHRPVHPRLLELVHRAVRHFRAPYVYVVSGYRGSNPRSRHAQGRAVDLVLPGVPDRRLAAYLRPQGFVGVGIYPTSGFVHLDVRARSYFWSDSSAPGQRNRERRILRTLGPRFDRVARSLGAEPVPDVEELDEDEELEEVDERTIGEGAFGSDGEAPVTGPSAAHGEVGAFVSRPEDAGVDGPARP